MFPHVGPYYKTSRNIVRPNWATTKNLKNPSFAVFSSLKGILSRDDFDIVHGFNIPSAYAMKFAKGKKKVLTLHGVFGVHVSVLHSKPVSSVAKMAESQVLKWPDGLTTDSKATQKAYKEYAGLDFEILNHIADDFSKPILLMGGAGKPEHFSEALKTQKKENQQLFY